MFTEAGSAWFSGLVTCFTAGTADAGRRGNIQAESGLSRSWSLSLFLEELLQDADDAAGLGQVAVLRSGVLQQHVTISAALQELAAAEEGVVAGLRLAYETLQAVHVLNGLWSESSGEWKNRFMRAAEEEEGLTKRGTGNHSPEFAGISTG